MEPSILQRQELIAWYLLVCTHTQEAREAMRRMQEECSELPAQEVRQSPLAGPNNEHGAVPEPLVQQSTERQCARASKRSSNVVCRRG